MKAGRLLIYILPFLLMSCSTWTDLTKKESSFYTEKEKIILEETTSSISFRYGYETDIEIDYVYAAGKFSSSDIQAKSSKMKEVLKKYSTKEIISFYEKIYRMKEIASWKKNDYKKDKDWAKFTLLEKYLLPEIELFTDVLEKNVLSLAGEYSSVINQRKKQISLDVADELS